ncbi:MAG: M20/M25/M40 family metallo-hydrolase [Candidatus Thorarchaeota archaeon]|nr:M20/M25/M40 family metallo-hydrolase [Candidatus Thorarchaeota archaeon]
MLIDPVKEMKRLIEFDTVSSPPRKMPSSDCPTYIVKKLENLGFMAELLENEGVYTAFGRKGQGDFKILFLAHFDVVPVGDKWKSDPFRLKVEGDRMYGRGAADDKGAVLTLFLLAEMLQSADPGCCVMIAATGDEEIGGSRGAGFLVEHLRKQGLYPDYLVVCDGVDQQIIHRRRNILPTSIKFKQSIERIRGTEETIRFETETFLTDSRHSAYMRPGVDRHAMLAASKYLDLNPLVKVKNIQGAFIKSNVVPDWVELDLVHPDESATEIEFDKNLTGVMQSLLAISQAAFPTFHSDRGKIVSPNLISLEDGLWTLYCDIRAMTNDSEAVEEFIHEAVDEGVELFSLKTERGAGFVKSDPDCKLIRAAKWALKKENIPILLFEGFGASDSRFFAGSRTQLFDFGPQGANIHGPNEWVSLSSIQQNAKFFHTLIDVLVRNPKGL